LVFLPLFSIHSYLLLFLYSFSFIVLLLIIDVLDKITEGVIIFLSPLNLNLDVEWEENEEIFEEYDKLPGESAEVFEFFF
jgi:hypothetical protein